MVVVIDDDEAVLDSTRFLLEAAGLETTGFASAVRFLEGPPDLPILCLLVDHHMPGMNGLELIERMKVLQPALPVILMSGQLDQTIRQKALSLGAIAVLDKPLSRAALFAAIDTVAPATARRCVNR